MFFLVIPSLSKMEAWENWFNVVWVYFFAELCVGVRDELSQRYSYRTSDLLSGTDTE